ncbi:MAG TPA: galactokinase family protein, partial [Candidatus Limnocylindrales bacterium]|nr:galactokinase family protein [Candidatus Limnocylindrales bacterium]
MEPGIAPRPEDIDRIDPAGLRRRLRELDAEAASAPTDDRIEVVRAPGRVNLIGEHTDYNEGFVLPAAIGLEIRLAFVPTEDRRVTITLDATGDTASFDLDAIGAPTRTWIDYVAGTARALQGGGFPLRGIRGLLASTLPAGAGLSSSAALEMASGLAMLSDPAAIALESLARAGQLAENDYVGVQIGIMDQVAS